MEEYKLKKPDYMKKKKRVGCGHSAGGGKTCGRGMNGQKSRSGSGRRPWFEGGQMPLLRRVPKRGFTSPFKKEYQIVNIAQLEKADKNEVTIKDLVAMGFIKDTVKPVKILGKGELSKKVEVQAHAFSKSAAEKISKAGGNAVVVSEKNNKSD